MQLCCKSAVSNLLMGVVAVQIKGKKPVQIGTYATVIGGGWRQIAAVCAESASA